MKKYKSFINEKLGVNKDIEYFSSIVNNFINDKVINVINKSKVKSLYKKYFKFDFPLDNIPPTMVNNMKVNSFDVEIYLKPWDENQMFTHLNDDNSLELTLSVSPDYDNVIKQSNIEHELKHLYQFVRNVDLKKGEIHRDPNNDMYYNLSNIRGYYKNDYFEVFNHLIYLSLDNEIDARTQQCYRMLINTGTTKDNFLTNLKNNEQYEYSIFLKKHEVINRIKDGNMVRFVSIWKFMYDNMIFLNKYSDYSGFWGKLKYVDLIGNIHDIFLRYFGPIKKPKILKKSKPQSINMSEIFYDEVSEKEALDFLNKWEKIFDNQGNKFYRKLSRLYDKFN